MSFNALSAVLLGRYTDFITVDDAFKIFNIIESLASAYAETAGNDLADYIETPLFRVSKNSAPVFDAQVQNFPMTKSPMDILYYRYDTSYYSLPDSSLSTLQQASLNNWNYFQSSLRMSFVQFLFPIDIFNISFVNASVYIVRVSFNRISK